MAAPAVFYPARALGSDGVDDRPRVPVVIRPGWPDKRRRLADV